MEWRKPLKNLPCSDNMIYEIAEKAENALKNKTLRVPWDKISLIEPTKEVRDGLKIGMYDGKYIVFSIYNSYKIQQNTQFIINYIQNKKMDNTNMYS